MEIVRKLPEDLARRVYSFGYAEWHELHAKINEIILDWNTLVNTNIRSELVMRMNESERARLYQWSRFCRCCERHYQNRCLEPTHNLPQNDCMCHCRQHVRSCIKAKNHGKGFFKRVPTQYYRLMDVF